MTAMAAEPMIEEFKPVPVARGTGALAALAFRLRTWADLQLLTATWLRRAPPIRASTCLRRAASACSATPR
jgi:hypothetical protein